MKRKISRLNKKIAQTLVKKVLGVSGAELTKKETGDGADIYHMTMGELEIKVENDWFGQRNLFILSIVAPMSAYGPLRLFFHPDTLEEDYAAEEEWRKAD